jgi:hypothetical protein
MSGDPPITDVPWAKEIPHIDALRSVPPPPAELDTGAEYATDLGEPDAVEVVAATVPTPAAVGAAAAG